MNDVMMTQCQISSADSVSESGYNSAASTGSLSDQVGHVVDVTVAALELINGSPPAPEHGDRTIFGETARASDTEKPKARQVASFAPRGHGYDNADVGINLTSLSSRQSSDRSSELSESTDDSTEQETANRRRDIGDSVNTPSDDVSRYGVTSPIDGRDNELYDEQNPAEKRPINSAETNGKRLPRKDTRVGDKRPKSSRKETVMAKYDCTGATKRAQNGTREGITRPPPHVLPPCKVCGIQATGFHYGVNTCEACKGFFRRSIIRKDPYVCANNPAKCTISPGKRKTCPLCRYKKCIEAGMSVDGIKIGRYTYAKRTQDILELRQANAVVEEDNGSEQDEPEPEPESDIPIDSEDEQSRDIIQFIDTVLKANDLKDPESPQIMALIEKIQKQVKEQHDKGQLPTRIPMDQFFSVLSSTGVQLDNRMQVLQQWVVLLNDGLKYLVNFAKMIPGFRDLKLSDQMALIKHSICEVWIIGRYMSFHKDLDYFITVNGMAIDVIKTLGEDFGSSIMRVTRRLRSLALTKEEIIIVKALVIFFTDRCDLHDAEKVNQIRNKLLDALLYLLNQRDASIALYVGRLSAILTELRYMTEMYQEYTKKLLIVSNKTGVMNFPPLLLEVMSFPDIT